jgi:hypothetical protein
MTADVVVTPEPDVIRPSPFARFRRTRVATFLVSLFRQTLADPIREGRLRDVGWPRGLTSIVVAGYAMFVLAGLVVMLSGSIRRGSTMIISGSLGVGLPHSAVWALLVLLSFGAAAFMTAALHAPWWLKVLGLLFVLIILGMWSLRASSLSGWVGWPYVAGAIMVAIAIFVIVRWRGRFAWWDFAVLWLLIGAGMTVGVVEDRAAKQFGFDADALLLQETASVLGYLALPAATLAGASVAEVTVRATVSATRSAQRLTHRRWPYLILLVILAGRAVQIVRQLLSRDPVSGGVLAYLPAVAIVIGFAVLGTVLLTLSRRRESSPIVSELGDEFGHVGFVIAVALTGVLLPVQILLAVVQVLGQLDPGGAVSKQSLNITPLISDAVDPLRVLIGVVLVVLAVRAARRGRPGRGLVLGCTGVMLIALARNLLLGDATAAPIDPDVLNVVATAAVVVAVLVTLVRRRLGPERALAYAGVLILCALFSYRNFISDPVGFLLGFSGAALVLFGLTWDLFTGSDWGNGDSRRFPRHARVLLVLTNAVLTMTVLAYAALIRDGSTTIYLDPYAQFGDLVFGTALLAAAVIAVFDAASRGAYVS